jgi:hypothetical protein
MQTEESTDGEEAGQADTQHQQGGSPATKDLHAGPHQGLK